MKLLQYAVCVFSLTLAAAAQSAQPNTAPAQPAAPPAAAAKPMQLSGLDGDTVKGPEHPLTLEQMKELYVAMGYDKLFDQNRTQMLTAQKARMPFIPQDVWDDLDATSAKVDYPAAFLGVYKKYLSTEDAAKLIEFAKTPAGKAFLANLPAISRETNAAVQKQQQDVSGQVQGRHKDELEAAFKKYQEEHQPKPAPSLGPTSGAAPPATAKPSTPATTAAPATPPANPPSTTPNN
jgi:hypothetical protein